MKTEQIIAGRYRIIKCLGEGGFSTTYLAIDQQNSANSPCVVKHFSPQWKGRESLAKASELFELEATRLENLGKHPQIAQIFNYFKVDNSQYLVLEYIEGDNLSEILAKRGVFNESQIRYLLANLLPVLEFVHSENIIHRDIKPENIIRSANGQLVLVDFGAAKEAIGSALLRTGTIIGTPEYIAPEQLRGKASFASDLYSLGVTCIHLLTQMSPFDLFDTGEFCWVWHHYLVNNPISDELTKILNRLIEDATNNRYQSASEVLQDLNARSNQLSVITQPVSFPSAKNSVGWKRPQTLSDYWSSVSCVAFSPDGNILAGGSFDRTIRLWRPQTGEFMISLLGSSQPILAIAFSPDGKLLAGGSGDGQIHLWNLENSEEVIAIAAHETDRVSMSITFSPKGDIIASGSDDGTVKIWKLSTCKLCHTLQHSRGINGIAISANGELLAAASSDNSIHLWEVNSTEHLGQLLGHERDINAIAFSPNSQILASASSDNTIKLWDMETQQLLKTLTGHEDWVRTVAFIRSPDQDRKSLLVSGSADRTIKIWDLDQGKAIDTLVGHTKDINAIAISPNHRTIASGSSDNTIKIWRRE
ncbi:MAG: serine/threonine protein kinase [Limnospira sp. PMC 1291.21]|uniref:serine/threonine-protein kinase n=1 Tax=unclassified Limnospira TaxID=2642885 RepID=UPI0028E11F4E|nr:MULTISPECIES: serine/threonine-protein kinase [unclassified Limnospira]MDT9178091.1 serine/threonine protein kinase [Limnospira sp. PMC 1238.20]MDT9193314.1 serine/threonine protein kinase [Limnospira sp. PMC 1245.20]MDT9203626.1 serine/threonine protein kinase [Limnospira sp. PMC 1243.20]MDT9208738.1 serine/threonine protein kinase [Limnospira sp. PMC 1252.20]MDT9213948.1 serine/threonine protein kinase [Limnospira sp. PMC 1256.20]